MSKHEPITATFVNLWAASDAELSTLRLSIATVGKAVVDSGSGALVSMDFLGRVLDVIDIERERRGIVSERVPYQKLRLEISPVETPEKTVLN